MYYIYIYSEVNNSFVLYLYNLCIPQAILCTHDAVAQKDYYPHLPDIPPELDDEEETVKIVQLVKSDEPLVRISLKYSIIQQQYYDKHQ